VKAPQIGPSDDLDQRGTRRAVSVLVCGGLDPGGGAGLVRDVLTARARGAHAVAVGTAWTEQGPGVHRIEPRDPDALIDSVRHALTAKPAAVKIGMVPDPTGVAALVEALRNYEGPIVIDPVLASSRGGALFRGAPAELGPLLRRATLATPNAAEAAALTGVGVSDTEGAAAAGRALVADGVAAVLVKGGHLGGEAAPVVDTLVTREGPRRLAHARVAGGDVRGTGCALATAIAIELGRGAPLVAAVEAATAWLTRALAAAVQVDGERHLS
jgi:hydroxymethylpyrimidine/phosphomethylpyrimidine kinase